jgi:toxin CcdB
MPRLDVYEMPAGHKAGYLLDVQADLLSDLSTLVVVPLLPAAFAPKPIRDLNPVFEFGGGQHVMVTQAAAGIPRRELKRAVGSLAEEHDLITRALDILLLGF